MRSSVPGGSASGEMPSPLTGRSPRATACQDVSVVLLPAGGEATNVPAPGWVTTSPSAASRARARDTVTGLTWRASVSDRVEGRRSPGDRRRTSVRSQSASVVLLSLFMKDKDIATVLEGLAVPAGDRRRYRTGAGARPQAPAAAMGSRAARFR